MSELMQAQENSKKCAGPPERRNGVQTRAKATLRRPFQLFRVEATNEEIEDDLAKIMRGIGDLTKRPMTRGDLSQETDVKDTEQNKPGMANATPRQEVKIP
ncbi:hypothetical protein BSKO_11987 [Bryopsis sp. KO-2023]|nr:hypothetical protein BSKO_11987 [Bryopsis sp. KO-2023]